MRGMTATIPCSKRGGSQALAVVYNKEGDTDKAVETIELALTLMEKTQGPEHLDYATALTNVGVMLDDAKRFDEALDDYRRAAQLVAKVGGRRSPAWRRCSAVNSAEALNLLHRFAEARAAAEEALRIWRRAGSSTFYQGYALMTLGEALLGEGRPREAAVRSRKRSLSFGLIRRRSSTPPASRSRAPWRRRPRRGRGRSPSPARRRPATGSRAPRRPRWPRSTTGSERQRNARRPDHAKVRQRPHLLHFNSRHSRPAAPMGAAGRSGGPVRSETEADALQGDEARRVGDGAAAGARVHLDVDRARGLDVEAPLPAGADVDRGVDAGRGTGADGQREDCPDVPLAIAPCSRTTPPEAETAAARVLNGELTHPVLSGSAVNPVATSGYQTPSSDVNCVGIVALIGYSRVTAPAGVIWSRPGAAPNMSVLT